MSSLEEPLNWCQLISMIDTTHELSQREVVVGVMGCLSGSTTVCFGWNQSDEHFFVRKGLSGDHLLNQTLLYNYLHYYCKYGTAFRRMFDFCYNDVKDEDLVLCFTFNAFRSSLRCLLIDHIKHLNTISDHLVSNNAHNRSVSLLGLKYWLDCDQNHNLLLRIEILWQIFEQIRETALNESNNYSLSFAILNAVYHRIDFQKTSIRNILFKLFIDCLKPTLDYFGYILTNGVVRDSHQEFVFIESDDDIYSTNFWNNCLQIRSDLSQIPHFLAKHLNTILIASKSRLMSRRLTFATNISSDDKSIDLYNKFITVLNELFRKSDFLRDKNTSNEIQTADTNGEPVDEFEIMPKSLAMNPLEMTEYDSDLNYFDVYSLHNQVFYDHNICFELNDGNNSLDTNLPQKCFKTIELIVNEALTQTICHICSAISSQLIHVILNEYKNYFQNVCDFYLLRSSRVIPTYCLDLFHNINEMNASKADSLYVLENDTTFESVPNIKPFVSYDKLTTDSVHIFKNIHLIYSPIEWPFNGLFNDEVMGVLNQVFQLLLKVKYSKWLLDQLMFSPQFKSPLVKNRNQNIMRFKLQISVNKLYNYLMTRIDVHINETIDRFTHLTNFEDLLQIHNQFVVKLKQTIFDKQTTLRNIVNKLIELCSQLERIWSSDHKVNEESVLKNIDLDINRCNHLLECFYEVLNQNS